jgi:hypothetical protein
MCGVYVAVYILSLLHLLLFLTARGWDRLSVLWFVGQQLPAEVTLRAVLIYFPHFVVMFFTLFLVKLVLWLSLLFAF